MNTASALQLTRRGRERANAGDLAAALADFEQAVRIAPHVVDGWFFLGVTLDRIGRPAEAASALRRAVELVPDRIEVIGALAYAEFRAGNPLGAEPLFAQVCRARPRDVDCHLKHGECLSQLARTEEAVEVFRAALARMPEEPGLWLALAQACDESGDRDGARGAYEQALALKPGWPRALAGLLSIDRGRAPDGLIAQARAIVDDRSLDPTGRVILGHELGKALDAREEYDAAMEVWQLANGLRREQAGPLDRGALAARVEGYLRVTVAPGSGASDDPRPVFVVGMPRSGTTLVEQVLAAHPQVAACGEMRELAQLAHGLPQEARTDNARMAFEANRYLAAAVRRGGDKQAARLVDKQPLNLFYLDLVAQLFSAAHVIWCRRDPRDLALSIFAEHMSPETRFSTDLDDIAHFLEATETVMAHWQQALPLPILEVSYETFVGEFDTQARRLVDFVGLPWDDACLSFHERAGAVQTPSRWQVRRPIHAGSVERWRHYERWFRPQTVG